MASSPTVLAWGYWGWGEATKELVARFDAVDSSRGFRPPVLVDVRASRSVRANGFRADAFEKVVGPDRYRWLQGLGNAAVATGKGPMRLVRPETANELLSLVREASREGRRVIYFCSCDSPWRAATCHRHLVGTTLLKVARAEGFEMSLQEWPGGEPSGGVVCSFEVPRRTLAALRAVKARWASLGGRIPTAFEMGLPIGSLVRLTEGTDELVVATCPPCLVTGVWKLPLLVPPIDGESQAKLVARVQATRERMALGVRQI
jgi:hypothetical protein